MQRAFKAIVALALALAALGAVAVYLGLGGGGGWGGGDTRLAIVSGSENRGLEPIVQEWGRREGVEVDVTYMGSVDISRELAKGAEGAFDAVWPAHSLWIELGDDARLVKHRESILRSPVVLGLRRAIAEDLGWIGRDDVTVQMIRQAAEEGAFRLAMTSATQSNSGASAYLGFLYALAGDPDVLTLDHLADPGLQADVRALLAQVDRSSGSSGWLKDAVVANPDAYDAMFNYEAMVLEADAALTAAGQEPLYIVYPANGLAVADSPLGLVDKGDAAVEEAFLALQAHLLAPETQRTLIEAGRRAGLIGMTGGGGAAIWNPDWGVDLDRAIVPVPTPASEVIREALRLYQTELRKPSLTVWVLDTSGSMEGEPLRQLKAAMDLLLDPEAAALNLLQPSPRDVTIILPFSNTTQAPLVLTGATDDDLARARAYVDALEAGGGTDLYYAIAQAMELLEPYAQEGTLFDYLPAIVAMTDGASDVRNREPLFDWMKGLSYGRDVPIHAIAFGEADAAQLQELNAATIGRLFHAGDDLAEALRSAKGYN